MTDATNRLLRYTDLTSLIHILSTKHLSLLRPDEWQDRNDSYYLKLYAKSHNFDQLFALCFTTVNETFHHWHAFAGGQSGVCVFFNRTKLATAIRAFDESIQMDDVSYVEMTTMESKVSRINGSRLPFLKRYPYRDEKEFRVVLGTTDSRLAAKASIEIPISLACIESVSLSPRLPEKLKRTVRTVLKSIPGCGDLRVSRSTLLENQRWKRCGDAISLR